MAFSHLEGPSGPLDSCKKKIAPPFFYKGPPLYPPRRRPPLPLAQSKKELEKNTPIFFYRGPHYTPPPPAAAPTPTPCRVFFVLFTPIVFIGGLPLIPPPRCCPPYPLHILLFFFIGPPPATAPYHLHGEKKKEKKMAAILDFTDVKNVTERREGKEGTRLGFLCGLEGMVPYGHLLLAPAEGWWSLAT